MTSVQQPDLKTFQAGVKPSADIRGLDGIILQRQHPSIPISHPSHPTFGDVCNESVCNKRNKVSTTKTSYISGR